MKKAKVSALLALVALAAFDTIPGVRLVYGAEDWAAVDQSTSRPGGKLRIAYVGGTAIPFNGTAASRKPGESNPSDVGKAGVARYFTVVQDCTMATKLRAAR